MIELPVPPPHSDSYLVRFWFDRLNPARQRIWVEHIPSGQQAVLHDLYDLLSFIRQHRTIPPGSMGGGSRLR